MRGWGAPRTRSPPIASPPTSRDRRAAAQGRLREIVLRYAMGDMPRRDVIGELETLTTVWRGDDTEAEGLKLLAHLYTEDGRYREAFHVMRTAMMAHPNSELTRQIQDEAAATFESLFLAGKGDAMPPIEALGLFYDYRELTPIGRRGDEMIRKLADRLVSVDLLDQAAELLQHQVDHRLQGAARAQVATRLAVIYLMARKPDRALATLQATRTAELSNELRDQRLLLEARALSDIGRHDVALEVIANIKGHEAIRLRSDILWAAQALAEAAEQIELLYGERWKQFTPLTEAERSDILRAAIGYALADEAIGLARFREKYAAKMADGPDRRAFDVVSAPIGTSGAEFQDIAQDAQPASIRSMVSCATCARAIRICRPLPATKAAAPAVLRRPSRKRRRQGARRPKRRSMRRQSPMPRRRRCRRKRGKRRCAQARSSRRPGRLQRCRGRGRNARDLNEFRICVGARSAAHRRACATCCAVPRAHRARCRSSGSASPRPGSSRPPARRRSA